MKGGQRGRAHLMSATEAYRTRCGRAWLTWTKGKALLVHLTAVDDPKHATCGLCLRGKATRS